MAGLPPIHTVVGGHLTAYESLYKQADVTGTGKIQAATAAVFLKKSGLKEPVLHKIWECCDRLGRGYLDKQAMIVALKLVALAQMGKEVDMANITLPAPIPSLSASLPRTASPPVVADNSWAVTPEEKTRYDGIFDGLNPVDNKLSGDKVKPVFLNSKLQVETLSKIWDLSDIDTDGLLDRDEFAVAMHLVFKALEKEPTPNTLPPNLMPPSKRKKPGVLPGAVNVLPSAAPVKPLNSTGSASVGLLGTEMLRPQSPAGSTWVVSSQEKSQADVIFKQIDSDVDGFVGGEEVRPILLQSGVPQPELAQIWNLCDIKQTGRLNSEQFALAMYLVNQAKNGNKPPAQLTPEMIPPSSRPKPTSDSSNIDDISSSLVGGVPLGGDSSFNKEMDTINKEIEGFAKEKTQLQLDIRDKEEQVKIRMLEVESLQSELDKNQSQIRQLDNQKSEAEGKLDELEEQKKKVEGLLAEVQQQCKETQTIVDELHKQIENQQNAVKNQEEELNRARQELNALRQEELESEQKQEASKTQLQMLQTNLKQTNDEIIKLQSKINIIREGQQKLNGSITQYDNALETSKTTGELPQVEEMPPLGELNLQKADDAFSSRATAGSSPVSSLSAYSISSEPVSKMDEDDPFKGKDMFADIGTNAADDPFKTDDPFKDTDPFKSTGFASDPFGSDPFKSSDPFAGESGPTTSDPFQGDDPFAGGGLTNGQADAKPVIKDPFASFDVFSSSGFGSSDTFSKSSSTDNFGSDPFKTDDVPALPPKQKNKAAPQKTTSTPSTTSTINNDPFQAFGPTDTSSPSSSDPFGSASSVKSPSDPFSFNGSAKTEEANDPFSTSNMSKSSDPFASFSSSKVSDVSNDPFAPSNNSAADPFAISGSTTSDKSIDMFSAFGMSPGQTEQKDDPFAKVDDPFGGSFASNFDTKTSNKDNSKTDSTLDPFGEKTKDSKSDPFGGVQNDDPFGGSTSKSEGGGSDGFANFANFGNAQSESATIDDPVAWALQESLREKQKQDDLARQEEEDLQKALSLSRADFDDSEA